MVCCLVSAERSVCPAPPFIQLGIARNVDPVAAHSLETPITGVRRSHLNDNHKVGKAPAAVFRLAKRGGRCAEAAHRRIVRIGRYADAGVNNHIAVLKICRVNGHGIDRIADRTGLAISLQRVIAVLSLDHHVLADRARGNRRVGFACRCTCQAGR